MNQETKESKCWIFGDESGDLNSDRFFSIGIIGTRNPIEVEKVLKEIRVRTNYFGEVSYKLSDKRRALCGIRWVDWFFSEQKIAKFKIIIKDTQVFSVKYFEKNSYKVKAETLAYCQSYREVLNNFDGFTKERKIFTYSQKELEKLDVPSYLEGKVFGINKKDCFMGNPKQKKPHLDEFTLDAELLQLSDLLTSSIRGLVNAINDDGINKSWVKRMFHLNIIYHLPNIKEKILGKECFYYPSITPYEDQKFVVFYWNPKKA